MRSIKMPMEEEVRGELKEVGYEKQGRDNLKGMNSFFLSVILLFISDLQK